MSVFWGVVPCSLVEINGRFRGAYCLHQRGDSPEKPVSFYHITLRNFPEDSHQLLKLILNILTFSLAPHIPSRDTKVPTGIRLAIRDVLCCHVKIPTS
jgi:hypothetical protein